MRYRTKLYIALIGISAISLLLALSILANQSHKVLLMLTRSHSLSIAKTVASLIDPTLVAKANEARDFKNPDYIALRKELIRYMEVNQKRETFLADLYTLFIDPDDPSILYYGVDAGGDPIKPGSLYEDSDKEMVLKNIDTYYTDRKPVLHRWGLWISSFVPIRDSKGKYIATLGADINASTVHSGFMLLIRYALFSLVGSLLLALIIARLLAKNVTESLDHLCLTVEDIGKGNLNARAGLDSDDEFGTLSEQINVMGLGLKERDKLKVSFARYVSTHVMEKILHSETPLKLEGERRKMTILFTDIRQFTQLAEKLPPKEVVYLLNEYFELMIEVVFANFGTLDKFIGDGIMAEFGVPLDDDLQEEHAVKAAIEMHRALKKLNDKWQQEGKPFIRMGIGIHTGEAIAGNIGSDRRTEYTAIGDAVNVAARLENATKMLKEPILISETTYLGTKNKFPFKDLGTMALPGRREQIKVFTVDIDDE